MQGQRNFQSKNQNLSILLELDILQHVDYYIIAQHTMQYNYLVLFLARLIHCHSKCLFHILLYAACTMQYFLAFSGATLVLYCYCDKYLVKVFFYDTIFSTWPLSILLTCLLPGPGKDKTTTLLLLLLLYYDIICTIVQAGGQNMILAWAPSHESSSKNPGFQASIKLCLAS